MTPQKFQITSKLIALEELLSLQLNEKCYDWKGNYEQLQNVDLLSTLHSTAYLQNTSACQIVNGPFEIIMGMMCFDTNVNVQSHSIWNQYCKVKRASYIISMGGKKVAVQNVFGNITIILNQCRLHCVVSNS